MRGLILALLLTCTQAQALVVGRSVVSSGHVASNNCYDVRKQVEELCLMVPACVEKRQAEQQAASDEKAAAAAEKKRRYQNQQAVVRSRQAMQRAPQDYPADTPERKGFAERMRSVNLGK